MSCRDVRSVARQTWYSLSAVLLMGGCATEPQELATVDHVDLDRFMGDWYVIANIPTTVEKGAHNAVENYTLNDDGSIATRFTFRKDSFDGKEKEYNPKGFVTDTESNAVWGMRFVWPIKADYRVIYLDDEYSVTIIGRNKRDFVWIMAREPQMSDIRYDELVEFVESVGYDIAELRRVPQEW